eukprot:2449038-Ditylum_brightwellii.AAC.1
MMFAYKNYLATLTIDYNTISQSKISWAPGCRHAGCCMEEASRSVELSETQASGHDPAQDLCITWVKGRNVHAKLNGAYNNQIFIIRIPQQTTRTTRKVIRSSTMKSTQII